MSRMLLIILNIILFVFADIAYADKIIAVVEDTSITASELEVRKKLLKYFNNISNLSPEQDKMYTNMVLQSMIDDQVLLEYAKTVGLTVAPREINVFIDNIEKNGKLQPGALVNHIVNSLHIPLTELRNKIKTEIIRSKVIREALSRNVTISQEDVESMVLATNFRDASLKLQVFTAKNDNPKTVKFMSSLPSKIRSCKSIKYLWYKPFADLTEITSKLSELSPSMQATVKDLEVDEASGVMEDEEMRVVVVCEKTLEGFTPEDNNSIANFLGNKKLQIKAQKFFQDLRKKAYIKIMP